MERILVGWREQMMTARSLFIGDPARRVEARRPGGGEESAAPAVAADSPPSSDNTAA
jgi:hypothetical protein